MTLQALRSEIGTGAFFRVLRTWTATQRGGNGTTAEFVALAERVSGRQLDALFRAWLFTPAEPPRGTSLSATASDPVRSAAVGGAARTWRAGLEARLAAGR